MDSFIPTSNHPSNCKEYDYIVIGGGSGGIASARRAASYGARVALVEDHAIGGTCVNAGCVPKKLMYNAGYLADLLKLFPYYGFDSVGVLPLSPALVAGEVEASLEAAESIASLKGHATMTISQVQSESSSVTVSNATDEKHSSLHIHQSRIHAPHHSHSHGHGKNTFASHSHVPDGRYLLEHLTSLQKKILTMPQEKVKLRFDWGDLKTARDDYIRQLHGIYLASLERDKIDLFHDSAKFIDPYTIQLNKSELVLKGKYFLIASGGSPMFPVDIPGYEHGLTSDDFFKLEKQPSRVGIVGAGYIAVELAGIFHSLGSQVHLWCRGPTLLRTFDSSLSEHLVEAFVNNGVLFQPFANVLSVQKKVHADNHTTLQVRVSKRIERGVHDVKAASVVVEDEFEVDVLLWCIGRHPTTSSLNLSAVGIETDDGGYVYVNKESPSGFQTTLPHIHAIGDVVRGPHLTPYAIACGRFLPDLLFDKARERPLRSILVDQESFEVVPTVVFSHPPIGVVGLTEAQARIKFGTERIKIYSTRFTSMLYGLMPPGHRDRQLTFFKVVVLIPPPPLNEKDNAMNNNEDELVLGIHLIGHAADEILQGFAVALSKGNLTKADLDATLAIHPTAGEELVMLK